MEKSLKAAKELFTGYLCGHNLRRTAERYAVLEEVYACGGHVEAETLFQELNKRYRVSRATVYNTLELLLECGVILRHRLETGPAQYERACHVQSHGHLVCTVCGKVEEFTDNRLNDLAADAGEAFRFAVEHRNLYLYGKCKRCQLKSAPTGKKSV
ncbi:MAG: transcriptional repressor [Culturomica sp.]|jgi:Fur family ferric uptake transcriptional regulator|nr:transcriptional repressor [Culturomica sp.]